MLKIVAVLALINACTIPVTKSQLTCKGCPVILTGDGLKEAEEVLIGSLGKLASGSGPTYKLGRIISASRQPVSGTKYAIKASLNSGCSCSSEMCDVVIDLVPWMESKNEITIKCQSDAVEKKYSI